MPRLRPSLRTVAAVAAAVLALTGCTEDSAGPEVGADVQDVERENAPVYEGPGLLVGEEVTISGEVGQILTTRAFTISNEDVDGPLLIVSAPDRPELDESAVVRITGTVQEVTSNFEDAFAGRTELFERFVGETAIVAEQVEVLQLG